MSIDNNEDEAGIFFNEFYIFYKDVISRFKIKNSDWSNQSFFIDAPASFFKNLNKYFDELDSIEKFRFWFDSKLYTEMHKFPMYAFENKNDKILIKTKVIHGDEALDCLPFELYNMMLFNMNLF